MLRRLHAGHAPLARLLTAVPIGFGVTSSCSQRRFGAAPLARWAHLVRLRARRRRRRRWRGVCVQPASAWCCAASALVAPYSCVLSAVAAGVGVTSTCSWRRLGAASYACWSRFARLPTHRCRHWLRCGSCVQPASAWCCATCTLDSLCSLACSPPPPLAFARPLRAAGVSPVPRHLRLVSPRLVAASPPSPLALARPLCAVGGGSVLRHGHAGLDDTPDDAPLACWACRRPWRGWTAACVSAASPLDTRIRLGSSPSPLASAWPVSAQLRLSTRTPRQLGWRAHRRHRRFSTRGSGLARFACSSLSPPRVARLARSSPPPLALAWLLQAAGAGTASPSTRRSTWLGLRALRRRRRLRRTGGSYAKIRDLPEQIC